MINFEEIKNIDANTRIFVLHAGKNKKFFNVFKNRNFVFLNVPDINLSDEMLSNVNNIKRALLQRNENTKGLNSLAGSISTLYKIAKIGDMILVPNHGYYENFMLGEITSEFSTQDITQNEETHNSGIPYRKVKWTPLPLNANKKNLPKELANLLGNRKSIIEIIKKEHIKLILNIAFKKYVYDDTSKIYLSGKNYNGNDTSGIIETLIALENIKQKMNCDVEIQINFNSPGGFIIKGASIAALIVAAVFIGAMNKTPLAELKQEIISIETHYGNSDKDLCSNSLLASLDEESYNDLCSKTNHAHKSIGLEVE